MLPTASLHPIISVIRSGNGVMKVWGLGEDSQESNNVVTVYSTGFTNQLTDNETSPTGYEGTSTVCSLSVVNIKRQCTR